MTTDGGRIALMWGKPLASTPFKVGSQETARATQLALRFLEVDFSYTLNRVRGKRK